MESLPGLKHYFNPRFPRGKRRSPSFTLRQFLRFQSTLPAGEATLSFRPSSDGTNFNPRFPRGKRPSPGTRLFFASLFQSTLPAREATVPGLVFWAGAIFQSTLPAREATPVGCQMYRRSTISIHASREGSDSVKRGWQGFYALFQSTLSAGKATSGLPATAQYLSISIHASRRGSDWRKKRTNLRRYRISIHASRGGSDCHAPSASRGRAYFNPRFPRGKRQSG